MMKSVLRVTGVIVLLLLCYVVLQSIFSSLGVLAALAVGRWQGVVAGDIIEIASSADISALAGQAQEYYFAGMSIGHLLSIAIMLLVIHFTGLFRMRLSLFRSISWGALGVSTALVFTSMWVLNIFVQWFPLEDNMQDLFWGLSNDVVGALTISVFAPVLEEVLFRGAIQGYLTRKTGSPLLSVLVASLIFGIIHINPVQVVYATLLGVLFGWIYYRTGSLLSVIVGHVLNNSLATIVMLAAGDSGVEESAAANEAPAYFMFAVFAVISIALALKLNRMLPPVPVPWRESDEKSEAPAV